MKVADAMTRSVDFVDPSASVQTAATHMAEIDVGAVVIGTADRIEGILTDRDIIVRLVIAGLHPARVSAREVMTRDVVTCREDDEIEEVFAVMRENQFRRMPVLNADGKPVGIVTLGDLAKHVESPEKVAEKLREISEPHRSREAPADEPAKGESLQGESATEGKPEASAA